MRRGAQACARHLARANASANSRSDWYPRSWAHRTAAAASRAPKPRCSSRPASSPAGSGPRPSSREAAARARRRSSEASAAGGEGAPRGSSPDPAGTRSDAAGEVGEGSHGEGGGAFGSPDPRVPRLPPRELRAAPAAAPAALPPPARTPPQAQPSRARARGRSPAAAAVAARPMCIRQHRPSPRGLPGPPPNKGMEWREVSVGASVRPPPAAGAQ